MEFFFFFFFLPVRTLGAATAPSYTGTTLNEINCTKYELEQPWFHFKSRITHHASKLLRTVKWKHYKRPKNKHIFVSTFFPHSCGDISITTYLNA